jgi:bifunctional non-homologous end joining protein LigD
MGDQLTARRQLIEQHVLPKLADPIRYSPVLEASLSGLIRSVKQQGLEGLVAKRRDSKYQSGLRSGAWMKMRVNQGQELVIAGYTPSPKNFDALVIGYYRNGELMYAARTRNGFTPASGYAGLSQLRKQKLEVAGSSGAVQALRMENDAPVVGPDAPTANSKMLEPDIATARTEIPPTSGLRVIQE